MNELFVFLFLASLAGLAVGLVKPSIVRMKSRKNVGYVLGAAAFVFMIAIRFTAPSILKANLSTPQIATSATSSPDQTAVSTAAATTSAQTASADSCASAAIAAFQKVTATYTTTYQEGKDALGTTQYAGGSAGLQAFSDPNSAASKFSAWHRTFLAEQPSLGDLSIKAYGAASNCYSTANLTEPDALSNWDDDVNGLLSDIGIWGNDAVDWQDQGATTAKLDQDETKISSDLATVQQDISALR